MRRSMQTYLAVGFAAAMTYLGVGCDLFVPDGRQPRPIYDSSLDASGTDASSGFDGSIPKVDRCGAQQGGDAGMDAGGSEASAEPLPEDFQIGSNYEMRFSKFEFADGSPGALANPFLKDFLDQSREYPIIVLLHLKEIRPGPGVAKLRGGAGEKVDKQCAPMDGEECRYDWKDKTDDDYTPIRLDAESGELRGGLEQLDFIGTTQFEGGRTEEFTLPIHDIYFRDALIRPGDHGAKIEDGFIQGYVTEAEAKENEVTLSAGNTVPISDLLGTSDLNYDSDDDGELDSWCLKARFSAIETRIVDN